MKTTISVLKADIGSIGGHIKPSQELLAEVRNSVAANAKGLLIDYYISFTGDDIAILCTHTRGVNDEKIHKLAWDAFRAGTTVAKKAGLYGAGQDLLKDAFSGNVRGMGPAVAEMEIEERENEPFLFFAADKTDPGAYNLPFYLAFADPMYCSGLILSPKMSQGFKFRIIDVSYTEKNKIIELVAPEEIYDIAALLRDTEKYVIESIYSRSTGNQCAALSTQRLHNIAGKYTGKDDPVALVRVQGEFPATGEVLAPFNIGHYVAGFMRGSHIGPLMPCKLQTTISYFDGPPVVTGAAFSIKEGKLSEPADVFDHPYWEAIRMQVAHKASEIRRQGFCGPSMLPFSELEYGGVVEKLKELDKKFKFSD
ncbi:MAG: fructose-1,6-bisphosphate aldolase/phosphatase [Acidobacteriota bacterium]|nr:fructose-1,6-bisphosphate aldolase/phosphatase [Acidobacteriota bacterium]MDY0231062.1 fructose-1,6-bisphosphate aldolase/phosphatase [Candidatus Saccharicenans sp.]